MNNKNEVKVGDTISRWHGEPNYNILGWFDTPDNGVCALLETYELDGCHDIEKHFDCLSPDLYKLMVRSMLGGKRVTWDNLRSIEDPALYQIIESSTNIDSSADTTNCSLDGEEITIKGKTYKLTEVK